MQIFKYVINTRANEFLYLVGYVMDEKQKESDGKNRMENFSSTVTITSVDTGVYNDKDELYDPFDHRDKKHATSDGGSLAHLLKASLGTGILAMPSAIKNGGLLFGAICTILIGILCAHCVHILVRSSQVLCKRTRTPMMSFAQTAGAAFRIGPKPLRHLAKFSESFVDAAIGATCISGSCVYVVFISTSIKQVADYHTGTDISVRLYMLMLVPALLALGQIRNLKHLVPFSVIANISIMVGFAITLYYLFQDIKPISSVNLIASPGQLPKFFATVLFAIEGIGAVMPVENSMRTPEHFLGCPSVLNIAMTTVVALYAVIGVFGYLKYGELTLGSVTLNLDTTDVLSQAVKLLIALAILFTYGLQYYIGIDVIWGALRVRVSKKFQGIAETLLRIFLVIVTVIFAIAIPDLEPFISLIGSVLFSILGIAVPAIVETVSCWDNHLGTYRWRLWKNGTLVVLALLALVFGSWVSMVEIIKLYE
ncbi:proton-coupled amino acid transporter-like protein CG1139 isoform X2 [Neodiprion pinetum]|uniref:proton-coupled amino acid transporter-like protein CG1139 isoform X2 n=1 Tax=Neodiprion pinetum TaxID=441929 RepID=UPI001EDF78DD|nr:proton-coupled amino acid transporter-like protein CG1139 isoform X2 [Neodiprion pinetum]